ncbi:MAG: arsenite efflux transporter metallochaperone ArsD [Candidatus Melainabacteria bacterium]|nr:arsenite efflux transporter metallochaperone ArsD [Candidatus Melainabacteria bacterium]
MKIQVFEPPMCCSTGLCGASVDPVLVEFSANLDWLKRHGLEVERYNLSQQTSAFVSNEPVRELLHKEGNDSLPIILVDGKVASHGSYLGKDALAKLAGVDPESKASSFNLAIKASEAGASTCCSSEESEESCCDDSPSTDSQKQSCCS